MPLNLVFHRDGDRWRTRWFASARGTWDAQRLTPTQMGQRAIRMRLLGLRFGEMPRDVWIVMREAQSEAFATEEAVQHGFPRPMIDAFTSPEHLMTLRLLRGLEWPDVEKLVFTELDEDSFADPEDFEIAFFLEAGEQTPPVTDPLRVPDQKGPILFQVRQKFPAPVGRTVVHEKDIAGVTPPQLPEKLADRLPLVMDRADD